MEITELEAYLDNLIADIDNVDPKDVTLAYIQEQRKKRICPNMPFIEKVEPCSQPREELHKQ